MVIDGGGIRGYSSLLILNALMQRVAFWEEKLGKKFNAEELLPCHYFDFIWGTSTGGLIAIMVNVANLLLMAWCANIWNSSGGCA